MSVKFRYLINVIKCVLFRLLLLFINKRMGSHHNTKTYRGINQPLQLAKKRHQLFPGSSNLYDCQAHTTVQHKGEMNPNPF